MGNFVIAGSVGDLVAFWGVGLIWVLWGWWEFNGMREEILRGVTFLKAKTIGGGVVVVGLVVVEIDGGAEIICCCCWRRKEGFLRWVPAVATAAF